MRFAWLGLSVLLISACQQPQPTTDPIASGGGQVNPQSPIASHGAVGNAPATVLTTDPHVLKNKSIPKDVAWAEVVVNRKTGEGNYHLVEYITSETWMFWKKVDNADGTSVWTFIRPKYPGLKLEQLQPDPTRREPAARVDGRPERY